MPHLSHGIGAFVAELHGAGIEVNQMGWLRVMCGEHIDRILEHRRTDGYFPKVYGN